MIPSRISWWSSKTRDRRGASVVEFALVAPVLFLLLGGIIEFGQFFRIQHALNTATRRGARVAIVASATNNRVTETIRNNCANILGIKTSDVTVDIYVNGVKGGNLSEASQGSEIKVAVQIPFSKCGVSFYAKLLSISNLRATCIFERE